MHYDSVYIIHFSGHAVIIRLALVAFNTQSRSGSQKQIVIMANFRTVRSNKATEFIRETFRIFLLVSYRE